MRLHYLFFALFIFCSNQVEASSKIDSLMGELNLLEKQRPNLSLAQTRYQLGEEYRNDGKFERSLIEYNMGFEYAEAIDNLKLMTDCMIGLAKSHQRLTNYEKSLEFYTTLVTNYDHVIQDSQKAFIYSQISDIYQNLGENQKAYDLQMQALQICEEIADTNGIARSKYSLATIFYYQQQYDEALNYYNNAYELGQLVDNGILIYSCLAAIGSVHEKQGNMVQSLHYSRQSLDLAQEIDYSFGVAYAYGNLAATYWHIGDFKKAESFYIKSLRMKEELGDKWGVIGGNYGLGQTYVSWGFPDQAIMIITVGLEIAKSIDSKPRTMEGYKLLSDAYIAKKDKGAAFEYLSKYVALKDSVITEKTVEEMGQSKRRYEIQKKEQEIKLLQADNELFEKNQKIQNLRNYSFGFAILLLLVASGWFFSRNKLHQKMNSLLEEKNAMLNIKNEEINVKNDQLAESNENLSQFAYVASHDLKEPLRMINSYTRLLERRYTGLFDDNAKEFMFYITDAVGRMTTLLDDLLDFSRAGNKKVADELLDFNDIMFIVKSNLKIQMAELNATLIAEEKDIPAIKANRTQLVQLIQNLVSNGVKFRGERDPVVKVNCVPKDGMMLFSIADNGIGISKENQPKVFEMFRRLHTREEYAGTGIGLATCKRIIDHYGGDIWVESVLGEGSTFFFTLPAATKEPVLA